MALQHVLLLASTFNTFSTSQTTLSSKGRGLGFGCLNVGARAWISGYKLLASFNNHEEACNMLCGKGRVRTQDLVYESGAL